MSGYSATGRALRCRSAHRGRERVPALSPLLIQGAFRTPQTLLEGIDLGDTSDANKKKIADLVGGPDAFGSLKLRRSLPGTP